MEIEETQKRLDEQYNRWTIEVDDDGTAKIIVNPLSGWEEYEGDSVENVINKALNREMQKP